MSWVRLWRLALLSVFVGFFLTACGDESEPPVPALSADSGDSESSADAGDEQVASNEESTAEQTNETDESSPPTECELACIEQYEEMIAKVTPIQRVDSDQGGVGSKFCSNDTCTI